MWIEWKIVICYNPIRKRDVGRPTKTWSPSAYPITDDDDDFVFTCECLLVINFLLLVGLAKCHEPISLAGLSRVFL